MRIGLALIASAFNRQHSPHGSAVTRRTCFTARAYIVCIQSGGSPYSVEAWLHPVVRSQPSRSITREDVAPHSQHTHSHLISWSCRSEQASQVTDRCPETWSAHARCHGRTARGHVSAKTCQPHCNEESNNHADESCATHWHAGSSAAACCSSSTACSLGASHTSMRRKCGRCSTRHCSCSTSPRYGMCNTSVCTISCGSTSSHAT